MLHPDRFFPADTASRNVARRLFAQVERLPLICPHGHTEPAWFAENDAFRDPAQLLIVPDHYVVRMLVSQGVTHAELGVPTRDGTPIETDSRAIWRRFAQNYHLFRSTPVRHWMDYTLETLFGIEGPLNSQIADQTFDKIAEALAGDACRPRALYEKFGIEVLATTDACLDDLRHHQTIRDSDWQGNVVPTYRPDQVTNPDSDGFHEHIAKLGALTGEDTSTWAGFLAAHRQRRQYFISLGTTATDHGHPTARTADLPVDDCRALLGRVLKAGASAEDKELFRAQMLTEMARMSLEDGLVMQIHSGSRRNHSSMVFNRHGADRGFDIPGPTDFVEALRPLLNAHGHDPRLTVILFTLDETAYGRELAPLAAAYPCLRLGPAWWFFDSPDGMMRYREVTTETAGYYNTVGFNDDTRALSAIAARHDMARRVDCAFLAKQVVEHRLPEDEAAIVAKDLTYNLPRRAYGYEARI
ncbi:Uronate isomerase (plasmid) [Sulfitobacter sp. DSM 110093]|uniref:glucuronate isomerase n=1 Tax=Sulfitobacter sp. DSM 110093 TaxID=2883127 RepID=UPI001FAC5FE3|nr:glucuronate isomerase [Sulfitobacter sp. DSM 110093]UOA33878.1 Uronate isomerase [Sulfitobacter sp. DSM 110093]